MFPVRVCTKSVKSFVQLANKAALQEGGAKGVAGAEYKEHKWANEVNERTLYIKQIQHFWRIKNWLYLSTNTTDSIYKYNYGL